MKFYVGITDTAWFKYLAARRPNEVNFWRPMATTKFKAIPPGSPFLFKLRKPEHCIVGGGFFVGFSKLPLTIAWGDFEENNGAGDFESFKSRIAHYRRSRGLLTADPEIGCIMLTQPFFFERSDWVKVAAEWGDSIVQGKSFDTTDVEGRELWAKVETALSGGHPSRSGALVSEPIAGYGSVFGSQYLRTARLGQGVFRAMIMDAYNRKCCITGETTLPVLEAAHILPVSTKGDHRLRNGLLLRADMHILFDRGLIGVTPDYKIKISSSIRDQYLNGKVYYAHDGQSLRSIPSDPEICPDPDLLNWHLSNVFVP